MVSKVEEPLLSHEVRHEGLQMAMCDMRRKQTDDEARHFLY